MDDAHLRDAGAALLRWYADHRRELPWRGEDDPYRILVAEVMLQQTQVATVEERYDLFLERFPTLEALAGAPEEDVLDAWAGLGFYRRARNLHRAARAVVADHGGVVPRDPALLRALPGVGPYTAGAVASIAFGVPEPAVDANAERVLARLTGEEGNVARAGPRRRLSAAARKLQDAGHPGDATQAIMELGALVCTPRRPACGACPLATRCEARRLGIVTDVPRRDDPPAAKHRDVVALVFLRGDHVLLERADDDGLLAGTWGFPWRVLAEGDDWRGAARCGAEDRGLRVAGLELAGRFPYAFSHRRWDLRVARVEVAGAAGAPPEGARWASRREVTTLGLPTVQARVVDVLGFRG